MILQPFLQASALVGQASTFFPGWENPQKCPFLHCVPYMLKQSNRCWFWEPELNIPYYPSPPQMILQGRRKEASLPKGRGLMHS